MSMSMVHHHHHHPAKAYEAPGLSGRETKRSERAESRAEPSDDRDTRGDRTASGPGPRGNPLVGALMKALQGLQSNAVASVSPAPAGGQPVATLEAQGPAPTASPGSTVVPGASPASAGDLKEAAYAFANELFSALRGVGQSRDDEGRGRHHGHGHGHGHHGHAHAAWQRSGRREEDSGRFAGLVDRLQALAGSLASPRPTATAAAVTPATAAAVGSTAPAATPAAQPTPPTEAAAVPATPATSTPPPKAISIQINIQVAFDIGAPAPEQASPLLAAFQQLMDKLSPSPQGSASTTEDAASRLKTFLLDMASALAAGGQRSADLPAPVGGLLNLTA